MRRFALCFVMKSYTVIQPIPSATENTRIARMKIGAIHFIMIVNNFSLLKVLSVAFTSSTVVLGLIITSIIKQVKKPL